MVRHRDNGSLWSLIYSSRRRRRSTAGGGGRQAINNNTNWDVAHLFVCVTLSCRRMLHNHTCMVMMFSRGSSLHQTPVKNVPFSHVHFYSYVFIRVKAPSLTHQTPRIYVYLQLIIAAFITSGSRLKPSAHLRRCWQSVNAWSKNTKQPGFRTLTLKPNSIHICAHFKHEQNPSLSPLRYFPDVSFLLVTQQQSHTSTFRCIKSGWDVRGGETPQWSAVISFFSRTPVHTLTTSCFYSTVLSPDSGWTFPHLAVTKDQWKSNYVPKSISFTGCNLELFVTPNSV